MGKHRAKWKVYRLVVWRVISVATWGLKKTWGGHTSNSPVANLLAFVLLQAAVDMRFSTSNGQTNSCQKNPKVDKIKNSPACICTCSVKWMETEEKAREKEIKRVNNTESWRKTGRQGDTQHEWRAACTCQPTMIRLFCIGSLVALGA